MTRYNADLHHRRSVRLRGYDYAQAGAYIVTACTYERECIFGHIVDDEMVLNEAGGAVQRIWEGLPERFVTIEMDAVVVMPNHVHGIILITRDNQHHTAPGTGNTASLQGAASSAPTLGQIMRAFKSLSAIRVNAMLARSQRPVWQRSYYEHVIRNDAALKRIRQYVAENPACWAQDPENPRNLSGALLRPG
jgi:putative transposase